MNRKENVNGGRFYSKVFLVYCKTVNIQIFVFRAVEGGK